MSHQVNFFAALIIYSYTWNYVEGDALNEFGFVCHQNRFQIEQLRCRWNAEFLH